MALRANGPLLAQRPTGFGGPDMIVNRVEVVLCQDATGNWYVAYHLDGDHGLWIGVPERFGLPTLTVEEIGKGDFAGVHNPSQVQYSITFRRIENRAVVFYNCSVKDSSGAVLWHSRKPTTI